MAKKKAPIPAAQKALIDQLIRERGVPQALFDKEGLLDQLKKRFIEQALEAEMDEHLGYPKHAPMVPNSGNARHGHGSKTIIVDSDQLEINPPRDRNSTFESQLIPKRQKRFKGFDEKIPLCLNIDVASNEEADYEIFESPEGKHSEKGNAA